jgi:hypothetical protein
VDRRRIGRIDAVRRLTTLMQRRYPDRMIRGLALVMTLALASGCAGAISPSYSPIELAQRCERTGGWWHPDQLLGGFCEYQAPGFP